MHCPHLSSYLYMFCILHNIVLTTNAIHFWFVEYFISGIRHYFKGTPASAKSTFSAHIFITFHRLHIPK